MTHRGRALVVAATLGLAAIGSSSSAAWGQEDQPYEPPVDQTVQTPAPTAATTPTTRVPGSPSTPSIPTTPTGAGTSATAVVTPASVPPGSSVTVSGSGFAPNQSLTVTFDSAPATPATATANASGAFSARITVPTGTTAGSHRIAVNGRNPQGAQLQAVGTVTVTLARTGAGETIAMTLVGLVLVGVGWRIVERTSWSRAISTASWLAARR